MTVVAPVRPLLALLDDMRSMIERVDDETYAASTRRPSGGGIGSHVRHCLDHVSTLVAATRTGMCAYDRRMRGTTVETCRRSALQCIDGLKGELSRLRGDIIEATVDVETQIDTDGSALITTSTVGRELMFVVSHTIHHHALLAHLLDTQGIAMESRFGLAPATPVREERLACAR